MSNLRSYTNMGKYPIEVEIDLESIIDGEIEDILDYLEDYHKYYFIKPENLLDKEKVEFFKENYEKLDVSKLKESMK